jgi:hypothetical protein
MVRVVCFPLACIVGCFSYQLWAVLPHEAVDQLEEIILSGDAAGIMGQQHTHGEGHGCSCDCLECMHAQLT